MAEKIQGAPSFSGRNSMRINVSTMKEVVQFWLSHKWAGETPTVDNVSWDGGSNSFVVSLTDEEKK